MFVANQNSLRVFQIYHTHRNGTYGPCENIMPPALAVAGGRKREGPAAVPTNQTLVANAINTLCNYNTCNLTALVKWSKRWWNTASQLNNIITKGHFNFNAKYAEMCSYENLAKWERDRCSLLQQLHQHSLEPVIKHIKVSETHSLLLPSSGNKRRKTHQQIRAVARARSS